MINLCKKNYTGPLLINLRRGEEFVLLSPHGQRDAGHFALAGMFTGKKGVALRCHHGHGVLKNK